VNDVGSGNPFAVVGRVLLPFGLGYFLSFLFRTINAVVGPEIGLLTSVYFLTFAAFQIPLGVLLDR
jgi:MFS family permease